MKRPNSFEIGEWNASIYQKLLHARFPADIVYEDDELLGVS